MIDAKVLGDGKALCPRFSQQLSAANWLLCQVECSMLKKIHIFHCKPQLCQFPRPGRLPWSLWSVQHPPCWCFSQVNILLYKTKQSGYTLSTKIGGFLDIFRKFLGPYANTLGPFGNTLRPFVNTWWSQQRLTSPLGWQSLHICFLFQMGSQRPRRGGACPWNCWTCLLQIGRSTYTYSSGWTTPK